MRDVLLDGEAERHVTVRFTSPNPLSVNVSGVGARRQRGQRIVSLGVADGGARALERRRRGGDGGAGNGQALLVFHDAADGAGLDTLGEERRRGGAEQREREHDEAFHEADLLRGHMPSC